MSNIAAQAVTPGRTTSVVFDFPEQIVTCPEWSVRCEGAEIAKNAASSSVTSNVPASSTATAQTGIGDDSAVNVRFWQSTGAWTCGLLQDAITNLHEFEDALGLIYRAPDLTIPNTQGGASPGPLLVEYAKWRQLAELAGVTYNASVSTFGDYHLSKVVNAGATWANGLASPSPAVPDAVAFSTPIDRVAIQASASAANQGYFLRWIAPGQKGQHLQFLWGFLFGQYAVYLDGSGMAHLYEFCNDAAGAPVTRHRDHWQYSLPDNVYNTEQTMAIFPHAGPNGEKFLAFSCNHLASSAPVSGVSPSPIPNQSPTEYAYRASESARGSDPDPFPAGITKSAPFQIDIRRDLRMEFQISRLGFAASGTLADAPRQLPDAFDTSNPVTISAFTKAGGSDSVTAALMDGDTGGAYAARTTANPYALFTFSSSGLTTPILWAYKMRRAAATSVTTDYTLTVGGGASVAGKIGQGGVTNVSIQGATDDASAQSGQVDISDPSGSAIRLSARGMLPVKVVVTVPSLSTNPLFQSVTLMRGYAVRPTSVPPRGYAAKSQGYGGQSRAGQFGAGGGALVYPGTAWRNYKVPISGMYLRLQETDYLGSYGARIRNYGSDPANPSVPWKVTDAIVDLLRQCGFTDNEIAIADYPVRLWALYNAKAQDLLVSPTDNLAGVIGRWCLNYLGASLHWEDNASSAGSARPNGAWTLIFPPTYAALDGTGANAPLWNFVTSPASGAIPHLPRSYPAQTSPAFGRTPITTVPPDFNCIHVLCPYAATSASGQAKIERYLYNHRSYPVPGSTAAISPTDPEYIGRQRKLTIIDPSLGGASDSDIQAAVDWTARRYYDVLCHGWRMCHLTAPLAIIPPNASASVAAPRLLRYMDVVSIDGDSSWLVKSATIRYSHDAVQMCDYELAQPVATGQMFRAGADALHFLRRSFAHVSAKAAGHATASNHHASLSASAHAEQQILALPTATASRYAAQNADGSFVAIPGYNVAAGSAA